MKAMPLSVEYVGDEGFAEGEHVRIVRELPKRRVACDRATRNRTSGFGFGGDFTSYYCTLALCRIDLISEKNGPQDVIRVDEGAHHTRQKVRGKQQGRCVEQEDANQSNSQLKHC